MIDKHKEGPAKQKRHVIASSLRWSTLLYITMTCNLYQCLWRTHMRNKWILACHMLVQGFVYTDTLLNLLLFHSSANHKLLRETWKAKTSQQASWVTGLHIRPLRTWHEHHGKKVQQWNHRHKQPEQMSQSSMPTAQHTCGSLTIDLFLDTSSEHYAKGQHFLWGQHFLYNI